MLHTPVGYETQRKSGTLNVTAAGRLTFVVSARAQLVDNYSLYSGSDGSDKDSATMYGREGKGVEKLGVGLPVRTPHTPSMVLSAHSQAFLILAVKQHCCVSACPVIVV